MKKIFFVVLLNIIALYNIYSQETATYNFLRLDVDAKSAALAGSYVSAENDVNSIFYNPAGLATLQQPQISAGFFKYLMDINSGNAAYSQKYKDAGYFGIGVRYVNYGSFDKVDENYVNQGTFSANDLAVSLGYANTYDSVFHFGANVKFIYSNIDVYKSTGLALDLGALYDIPSYLTTIGVSLLNAGAQISTYNGVKEKLPLDLRVGASKRLEYLPVTVYLSFNNLTETQDNFISHFKNFTLGGEFEVSDYIVLRAGYDNLIRQNLETGNSTGLGGFSAGLGFQYENRYMFDYSFNSIGKVGAVHRINLRYNFLK